MHRIKRPSSPPPSPGTTHDASPLKKQRVISRIPSISNLTMGANSYQKKQIAQLQHQILFHTNLVSSPANQLIGTIIDSLKSKTHFQKLAVYECMLSILDRGESLAELGALYFFIERDGEISDTLTSPLATRTREIKDEVNAIAGRQSSVADPKLKEQVPSGIMHYMMRSFVRMIVTPSSETFNIGGIHAVRALLQSQTATTNLRPEQLEHIELVTAYMLAHKETFCKLFESVKSTTLHPDMANLIRLDWKLPHNSEITSKRIAWTLLIALFEECNQIGTFNCYAVAPMNVFKAVQPDLLLEKMLETLSTGNVQIGQAAVVPIYPQLARRLKYFDTQRALVDPMRSDQLDALDRILTLCATNDTPIVRGRLTPIETLFDRVDNSQWAHWLYASFHANQLLMMMTCVAETLNLARVPLRRNLILKLTALYNGKVTQETLEKHVILEENIPDGSSHVALILNGKIKFCDTLHDLNDGLQTALNVAPLDLRALTNLFKELNGFDHAKIRLPSNGGASHCILDQLMGRTSRTVTIKSEDPAELIADLNRYITSLRADGNLPPRLLLSSGGHAFVCHPNSLSYTPAEFQTRIRTEMQSRTNRTEIIKLTQVEMEDILRDLNVMVSLPSPTRVQHPYHLSFHIFKMLAKQMPSPPSFEAIYTAICAKFDQPRSLIFADLNWRSGGDPGAPSHDHLALSYNHDMGCFFFEIFNQTRSIVQLPFSITKLYIDN